MLNHVRSGYVWIGHVWPCYNMFGKVLPV